MKSTKRCIFSILGMAIIVTSLYVYNVHFDYRFTEITEGKVYRSAKIPPNQIQDYIQDNGIKTVIDLRIGNLIDPLNPSLSADITAEKNAVEAIDGVRYVNIPSHQIPSEQNLEMFYETLDEEDAFPVLIHCHHGTGRAILYSALYRIEYEGFSNEEARSKTKFPLYLSSFDHGTPKGEWLKIYEKRKNEEYATTTSLKNEAIEN